MKSISVIIPVYNEARTILEVLDKVLRTELRDLYIFEVIVVDDASTDETDSLVKSYQSEKVVYIRKDKNEGKGSALQIGFKRAQGDVIIIQDGDLEYSPDDYQKLCDPILNNQVEVVYGSRFLEKKKWGKQLLTWRLANWFLTKVSNFFTGLRLTDMETCYKVFSRKILDTFKDTLVSQRFEIEVELTAYVAKAKAQIVEIPITYEGRSYKHGKKIGWRDGVEALVAVIKFKK